MRAKRTPRLSRRSASPLRAAEPVSAAQAEALGPALGPAIETPQTADPIDYSVGKDDTIVVVAEETLGHYADWLGITAQRLRKVNNMKFGRPVLIGRKLKLDFSKVKPEDIRGTRAANITARCRPATSPRTASWARRSTSFVAATRSGR